MTPTLKTLRAPLAALALLCASSGAAAAWEGGRIQVVQEGSGHTAAVVQNGADNFAALRQTGRRQTGAIVQNGDDNSACLIQVGRSRSTTIVQSGGETVGLLQLGSRPREIPLERCVQIVNDDVPFGRALNRR